MKQKNTSSNKVTKPHKYRVSIYLGKELYENLSSMAKFLNLPLATMTRIILDTGYQIGMKIDEKATMEVLNNANNKSKV